MLGGNTKERHAWMPVLRIRKCTVPPEPSQGFWRWSHCVQAGSPFQVVWNIPPTYRVRAVSARRMTGGVRRASVASAFLPPMHRSRARYRQPRATPRSSRGNTTSRHTSCPSTRGPRHAPFRAAPVAAHSCRPRDRINIHGAQGMDNGFPEQHPDYRWLDVDNYHCYSLNTLHPDDMRDVIGQVLAIDPKMRAGRRNGRYRFKGVISVPLDGMPRRAYVKRTAPLTSVNAMTDIRGRLREIRKRRLRNEAVHYLEFMALGLPCPRLILYGYRSLAGIPIEEFILTSFSGTSVKQVYRNTGRIEPVMKSVEVLARIHGAGLSHGDASIKNYVIASGSVRAIDLETVQSRSEESATKDLQRFCRDVHRESNSMEAVTACLDHYRRVSDFPVDRGAILSFPTHAPEVSNVEVSLQ